MIELGACLLALLRVSMTTAPGDLLERGCLTWVVERDGYILERAQQSKAAAVSREVYKSRAQIERYYKNFRFFFSFSFCYFLRG